MAAAGREALAAPARFCQDRAAARRWHSGVTKTRRPDRYHWEKHAARSAPGHPGPAAPEHVRRVGAAKKPKALKLPGQMSFSWQPACRTVMNHKGHKDPRHRFFLVFFVSFVVDNPRVYTK